MLFRSELKPRDAPPGAQTAQFTCGDLGQEVFQFEQIQTAQKVFKADGAKLRISTTHTELAIVDGQHRAMALLALYRNLKGGWNDARRQAYKHYYDVWPESFIRKFDTKNIQLPVMICTFPELDQNYSGDFDVIRAARRIFLTLNKNARKVSDSRNKLLDDQDIASECLRETLSLIKDANTRSQTSLRIFNVELDQEGDKQAIGNPFAITGVSHLYYVCERILFMNDRVTGLSSKSQRMAARRNLSYVFERLKLNHVLSQAEKEAARRDSYPDKIADQVKTEWRKIFGPLIVRLLGEVHPLKVHQLASLKKHVEVEQTLSESALKAILFDGQGTAKVLERFASQLKENIRDDAVNWATPEIEATKAAIENINHKREQVEKSLKELRALHYFEQFKGTLKSKLRKDGIVVKPIEEFVNRLMARVGGTVAFQTALIYTLVDMAESAGTQLDDEFVGEYIQQINNFFAPTTDAALRSFVGVFEGGLTESDEQLAIAETNTRFSDIVYTGEMQPDEWPKYRYLILEIWKSKSPAVAAKIEIEIKLLRLEIAEKVKDFEIKHYQEETGKLPGALTETERINCFAKADQRCKTFFDFFK